MDYTIPSPDNVVEASFSDDPDDVSVVSIAIKATPKASESLSDMDAIEFRLGEALTTTPGSVTPQARSFADWEMASSVRPDDDGNGVRVFVATPRRDLER